MALKKPFTYEEFKAIYSKVPRLSVDVIVQSKRGIAFTLRSIQPYKGYWHFPGSTVLYRESAVQTARRVAKDELGISIGAPKLLGYIEYNEEPHRDFGRSLSLVFLAPLRSGKLKFDGDASEAAYFSKLPAKLIPPQKSFAETPAGAFQLASRNFVFFAAVSHILLVLFGVLKPALLPLMRRTARA